MTAFMVGAVFAATTTHAYLALRRKRRAVATLHRIPRQRRAS